MNPEGAVMEGGRSPRRHRPDRNLIAEDRILFVGIVDYPKCRSRRARITKRFLPGQLRTCDP